MAAAQQQAQIVSPEVHPDRTVTFRLRAPKANEAAVSVNGVSPSGLKPMVKDEKGVWYATIGPLDPEIYSYTFSVDGPASPIRTTRISNPVFARRRA
jgi:1,4-alpha-glucan branching enzyme